MKTRLGELLLSVPQARCVEPFDPYPLVKWQRSERALLVACAEMYFQGVSTRKVGRVLSEMGGFELSASTVSRVAAELDERLSEFRHHGSIRKRAVLVVAGINEEGRQSPKNGRTRAAARAGTQPYHHRRLSPVRAKIAPPPGIPPPPPPAP